MRAMCQRIRCPNPIALDLDHSAPRSAHRNSVTYLGGRWVLCERGPNAQLWLQAAYIKASNSNTGDLFGISVALSGDTLAVGACYEASAALGIDGNQDDNTATESGAVYIFH